ncbi:MAG: hypothetical protein JXO22_06635 [Phycisphaerae bacterium]|nr:hypothetical protein [Phycisphaerae bacterium]
MTQLDRQVQLVRRRLLLNVMFDRALLGVLVATLVWVTVLLVERLFVLGIPVMPGLAVAAGLAVVVAVVGTLLTRVSDLRAAIVLDGAAGLKERISTALECRTAPDEFSQAAVRDAERRAGGVHVATHVPLRMPQRWRWPAASIVLALILGMFLPPLDVLAREDRDELTRQRQENRQQTEAIAVEVNEQLEQLKQLAAAKPELEDLRTALDPLKVPDDLDATPEDMRREALKRIDNVAEQLEQQRQSGTTEMLDTLKRNLAQLKPLGGNDPASELSKALAAGDFKGAQEAISKLQNAIDDATQNGDPEKQKDAAELQKQLSELAMKLEKLGDTGALRKELENKAGMSAEDAEKLLKQLAESGATDPQAIEKALQKALGDTKMSKEDVKKLARKVSQNQQACKARQGLAQSLAQAAAQCSQQCDTAGQGSSGASGSSGVLGNAAGQLSNLEMAEQLAQELEMQLSQLGDLRDDISDGSCQQPGPPGQPGGQGPRAGIGYGAGIGKQKTAHQLNPTKVEGKLNSGEIIGQVLIDAPQVRGEARSKSADAVRSAVRDAQDAIERERIPRQYHPAMRQYYERLAGLAPAEKDEPEPAKEGEK